MSNQSDKKRKMTSGASGSGKGDCESPKKWETFFYQSDSGRKSRLSNYEDPILYFHWLPSKQEELLPEQTFLKEGYLPAFYEEFDTLTHTTTMESAYSIIQYGFKPRPVKDSSVVNPSYDLINANTGSTITPRPLHPVGSSLVLWYGPSTLNQLQNPEFSVERYGNVLFSMCTLDGYEGIRRLGLKFYFVEVIKYLTTSACRILVSHKDYPTLKCYDPYTIGGPLYIQKTAEGYKYYYTSQLKCHDGTVVSNVLEIMKEEGDNNDYMKKASFINHDISFFICESPRKDVKSLVVPRESSVDIMSHLVPNILKLAIVLSFGKPLHQIQLLTPFDNIETRNKKLKEELERVHHEAFQRLEGEGKDRDLIGLAVQGIGQRFMSKRSIVESYCDLLNLVPEAQRSSLTDNLWEGIQETLADPVDQ